MSKADGWAAQRRYKRTPKGKYIDQKIQSRKRGIPFLLTFQEWWQIWQASGKWPLRGHKKHNFCMCRKDDAGPYDIGNVRIDTWRLNTAERNRVFARKQKERKVNEEKDKDLELDEDGNLPDPDADDEDEDDDDEADDEDDDGDND